jgi:tetraacyldisaccharide 4'-kinase
MHLIKPKFWDKKKQSFFSFFFYPISIIYYFFILIKKHFYRAHKFNIPIICIGNIYIGGTGKTSAAIEIYKIVNKYKKVCFLTKGYGRKNKKNVFLNEINYPNQNSENTGDEALLLNKFGHVYISDNRKEAIKNIIELKYEAIIIDDGFQDLSIFSDVNILCFDSDNWLGNNNLIPSGPLREPFSSIKRADFIIIKGKHNSLAETQIKKIDNNLKIIYAENSIENIENLSNKSFLVFCGIGNPDSFFNILLKNNIKITKKKIYPDHYQFENKDYKTLFEEAKNNKCELLTTEKDHTRIDNLYKDKVYYTKLNTSLSDKALLEKKFKQIFQ